MGVIAFLDEDTWIHIVLLVAFYMAVKWYQSTGSHGGSGTSSSWHRDDLVPAVEFLSELSQGSSVGHDKRLMAMLHSSVLAVSERGVIRALGRCVAHGHGSFMNLDYGSVVLRQNTQSCHMYAKARFDLWRDALIDVEVAWIKGNLNGAGVGRWSIVSFNVSAPPNNMMDVCSFIEADEFSVFGEQIVSSLFNRLPSFAHNVMVPQLKERYAHPRDIAVRVGPLLTACGGLRRAKSIDMILVSSFVTKEAPRQIELTYYVEGAARDMEVAIALHISEMQCYLSRYNIVALGPNKREVVI